jgi:hypothetical protein
MTELKNMTTAEMREFCNRLLKVAENFSKVSGQSVAESLLIVVKSLLK